MVTAQPIILTLIPLLKAVNLTQPTTVALFTSMDLMAIQLYHLLLAKQSQKYRITSYNVCYTKLLREGTYYFLLTIRGAQDISVPAYSANISGFIILRSVITSYSIHYTKLYDSPLTLGSTGSAVENCFAWFDSRIRNEGDTITGTDFWFMHNQAGRAWYFSRILYNVAPGISYNFV